MNGTVSKTVERATVPRVRIPLSPPFSTALSAISASRRIPRVFRKRLTSNRSWYRSWYRVRYRPSSPLKPSVRDAAINHPLLPPAHGNPTSRSLLLPAPISSAREMSIFFRELDPERRAAPIRISLGACPHREARRQADLLIGYARQLFGQTGQNGVNDDQPKKDGFSEYIGDELEAKLNDPNRRGELIGELRVYQKIISSPPPPSGRHICVSLHVCSLILLSSRVGFSQRF